MRVLFLLLAMILMACSSGSNGDVSSSTTQPDADQTILYFSRHAEKDSGDDPGLIAAGAARAQRIANRLADKNISAVYATGYRRTQATARPLADRIGTDVKTYSATAAPGPLVKRWLKRHKGQSLLVVGHSNTVPGLVNALLGENRFSDIAEEDYSNLYRVIVTADGKASVREMSSN